MAKREYPDHPLLGVGGIVFDAHGRVLLVQRGNEPRKGHWSIPGGLLELGETLIQGVQREIAEETGLTVQPHAIVEVVDRIYQEEVRVRYHYVIVDYWCTVLHGTPHPSSDAAALRWATRQEWHDANPHQLESLTLEVLEKAWKMALAAGAFSNL